MSLLLAARLAAAKSIATGTDVVLGGTDLVLAPGVMAEWAPRLASSAITVPYTDWYRLQFRGAFAPAATGVRLGRILLNSTAVSTASTLASDARVTPGTVADAPFDVDPPPLYLTAGDVVRFAVAQDRGSALNLTAAVASLELVERMDPRSTFPFPL